MSLYNEDAYVKLTHEDNINNGFKFKEGLNEDIYELNENEECSRGGLYFCKAKHVMKWLSNYGEFCNVWCVTIPEGEKVIEYETKLKAKRIILSNCRPFYEVGELCEIAIKTQNGYAVFDVWIRHQTERICELAVQQNGMTLQFVKTQTERICELAVQQNGLALQFVRNQTERICELAVQQNSDAVKYVKNQTERICELAVQQNGLLLQHVKNQTKRICELAVQQNKNALQYSKRYKELIRYIESVCKVYV